MGTPLLLATVGEILTEKAGHINLGVEGMMMIGAVTGFLVGFATNDPLLAALAAGMSGFLSSQIFAFLTVSLKANQLVAGFVLTIFLTGLANLIGSNYGNATLSSEFTQKIGAVAVPGLSRIPLIGPALFHQSIIVYLGIFIAVSAWVYLNKTRFGLSLKVVGENPSFADDAGIPVAVYQYVHIGIGGFLSGMAGACLTLVIVPRWQETVTAGMGWIAIALVIFATWNPSRAIFGAYLFGALKGLAFKFQGTSIEIGGASLSLPSQILDLFPYIITIAVLIAITLGKRRENQPPRWLGKAYFREER
ncbi:MAG: ABC transporter permease [Clostridiales Family XIII bacterium]|nr:ABC transporter permease [Clostridiales Family XIII bacterium]